MSSLRVFIARLLAAFQGARLDSTLDEEIGAHLDRLEEEHRARGLPPQAARDAARREFGGVEQMKEAYRDRRGLPWLSDLRRDVHHSFRALRRAPGFSVAAVLTLAFGIGANSAMFSLADAVLIRPLPFERPDRLVTLAELTPAQTRTSVSPLNFLDWAEQSQSFDSLAAVAVGSAGRTLPSAEGIPEEVPAQAVSARFFDVFGIKPVVGRTFTVADAEERASAVVLSERFWRERFGGSPDAIGRAIPLDGQPFTVIGVVPADFQVFAESHLWTPLSDRRGPEWRRTRYLRVVGRLKPDVTLEQARAEMAVIAANIARLSPATNRGWGVAVDPLRAQLIGPELRLTSLVLAGIMAFVLVMACANIANLLLARDAGRTRELAVRSALGASRQRIVRQLLTENLVLSMIGGVSGLFVCWALLRSAPSIIPIGMLPVGLALVFDGRVVAFAFVVTGTVGVVLGVLSAIQVMRRPLTDAIADGGRGTSAGAARLRMALVVGQIAAAVLVLMGAGLLVRTLAVLTTVDPGYRAQNVVTAGVSLPLTSTPDRLLAFYQTVERQLNDLPGVRAAAWGTTVPLAGRNYTQAYEVLGVPAHDPESRPAAGYHVVSAAYFDALDIPILAGRHFSDADTASSIQVCIVNEEFVRRHFGSRDPVGARIAVRPLALGSAQPVVREIVGVVRRVKESPGEAEEPVQIYVPLAQNPWAGATLVVRSDAAPAMLVPAIRAAVHRVAPNQALTAFRTIGEVARQSTATPRFRAYLAAAFAALAVVLASTGIFGVLSFLIRQRTREIGVRVALGARPRDVLRLVLDGSLRMTAAGVCLGLIGAAALSRTLTGLLFGVAPLDPLTFVTVPGLLALVAFLASVLPAWEATRVDPVVTFRSE